MECLRRVTTCTRCVPTYFIVINSVKIIYFIDFRVAYYPFFLLGKMFPCARVLCIGRKKKSAGFNNDPKWCIAAIKWSH